MVQVYDWSDCFYAEFQGLLLLVLSQWILMISKTTRTTEHKTMSIFWYPATKLWAAKIFEKSNESNLCWYVKPYSCETTDMGRSKHDEWIGIIWFVQSKSTKTELNLYLPRYAVVTTKCTRPNFLHHSMLTLIHQSFLLGRHARQWARILNYKISQDLL